MFTVIYDAEDRPDRNQLRHALQAFRSANDDLACVQARLCTDTDTSWLSCYFSAEYAAHFDIFLPKLAALGLPLPLGGSSNHFRTRILREVGGWDPHNVTEDADLGMRLARFGYRSGVIDSTTYEEAPANVCVWLGQRSRWFKGWMRLSRKQFWLCFQKRQDASTTGRNAIATILVRAPMFVHVRNNLLHVVDAAGEWGQCSRPRPWWHVKQSGSRTA
jgi:cellulose synthase/poly-beta-1,6-N-acetylglucosamine synthase-like glycosyltransferase